MASWKSVGPLTTSVFYELADSGTVCALSVIKTKKFARGKEEIEFLNMMLALYLLHYSTYRGGSGPLREDGKLQKMQIPLIITNCTRGTLSQT